MFFFFSSRRRHTRSDRDWSSDVCSSDLDALGGSSPIIARMLVVLPQPDSPTRPNRSPASRSKPTPCTACSSPPPGRPNQTFRSRTSSRLMFGRSYRARPAAGQRTQRPPPGGKVRDLQPRIERVLDGLAEQETPHDQQGDYQTIGHDRPPGAGADSGPVEGVLEDGPPGG